MSTQVGFYEEWMRLMRSWGFTVHEAAGWRTRDAEPRSNYLPGMLHLEHHDASTKLSGNWGALAYILQKNLANIVTARDGQITLCAAGVQWHAGVGSRGSLGNIPANGANPRSMGNEVANSGSEPYTDACTRAIIAAEAAWAIVSGNVDDLLRIIGHKEWADPPGRKNDPRIDMNQRRRDVAAFLATKLNSQNQPNQQEEDDMPSVQEIVDGVWTRRIGLRGPDGQLNGQETNMEVALAATPGQIEALAETLKEHITREVERGIAGAVQDIRTALVEGYGIKLDPR